MTQQLPPPPAGFTVAPQPAPNLPPPPAGFTALSEGQQAPQTQEQIHAKQPGILQGLVNVGRSISGVGRQTDETKAADELIEAPNRDVGAKLGFNLAFNFNSDEIESVVRQEFGDQSIRKDELGNTFATVAGKEYILNRPGLSKQDVGASIANMISFLPASRAAALGQTVLRKIGIGAATSAATQAVIEGGQAATGGEFSPEEIALAGAAGAVGEIPSAIMASKRLSRAARPLLPDITDAEAATARNIRDTTGVSLRPSQVSESQKDQLVDFLIAQDPQTSKKFGESLKRQSQETHSGLMSFLDELSTTDEAAAAALDVRNMSKKVIDDAVLKRTKITSPLFKEAHKAASKNQIILDTSDIISRLKGTSSKQVGGVKGQINKLISIIEDGSKGTKPKRIIAGVESRQGSAPRIGVNSDTLHNAKKEIDRFLKKESADRNINNFTIKVFESAKSEINDLLINNVDGFKSANDLYLSLSPGVDALKSSVGDVSKISDEKLSQVAKKIFNIDEFIANPKGFNQTKDIINNTNPDAWSALTRSRFQQDLAEVGVDSLEDALDPNFNFVQQLWSKSFKGKEKTLFRNALDGEQKKNYTAIADVFNKARKRPAQSGTAQLQGMKSALEGNKSVAQAVDGMMNPNAAGIFERVFGVPQVREQNNKILADIVTDPKWADRMTEIRKLGMDTPKGGAAFIQLFRDALHEDKPQEAQQ